MKRVARNHKHSQLIRVLEGMQLSNEDALNGGSIVGDPSMFDMLINNCSGAQLRVCDHVLPSALHVMTSPSVICTCTDSSEVNVLLLKTHYSV